MKKLKVYLDTSIIGFLFADDSPEFKKITVDFFNNYINDFEVFISDIVILELERTKDKYLRERLLKVIDDYKIKIIDTSNHEEIRRLAQVYIDENIIPENKLEDALHIAICTVNEYDILLSWNFKHIANVKKQTQINSVNMSNGYLKKISLLSLLEVEYAK